MQPSTICYCFHSPGNTPALQLPLLNALGGTQTLSLSVCKILQQDPAWPKWDRVILAWSACGRGKPLMLPLIPNVGLTHCHWRYLKKNHLQPHSPQGHHRGGHCELMPTVGALVPLRTHPPCCCHYKTFWEIPTCLISVTSQDPETRGSLYNTSYVG